LNITSTVSIIAWFHSIIVNGAWRQRRREPLWVVSSMKSHPQQPRVYVVGVFSTTHIPLRKLQGRPARPTNNSTRHSTFIVEIFIISSICPDDFVPI
jgi:hypothetical protein